MTYEEIFECVYDIKYVMSIKFALPMQSKCHEDDTYYAEL